MPKSNKILNHKQAIIGKTIPFLLCCATLFSCASSGETPKTSPPPDEIFQEVEVGRALAARLAKRYGLLRNEEATRYLNTVGRSLATISSRPELKFFFGILNTEEINAFACPGGYILITRGTLNVLEDESELASVLAHEIAHVALQHSGKFERRDSWVDFLAGMFGAGSSVLTTAMLQATDALEKRMLENGRQKEFEHQADQSAILYSSILGYDPAAGLRYLERIAKAQGVETLVKTHPSNNDRRKVIQQFLTEQGLPADGKRNQEAFQKFKDMLKANQSQ